ncbi:MAG: hypothetical protein WBF13_00175 [Candidatus Zixiibacteriota bacterium]
MFRQRDLNISLLVVLLSIVPFAFFAWDEASGITEHRIFPIANEITSADSAQFLVLFPRRDPFNCTWQIYFGGSNLPVAEGTLDSVARQRIFSFPISREGSHSILFVTCNDLGEPISVFTAEMQVCPSQIRKLFLGYSGIFVGALITLIAFAFQEKIRQRRENRKQIGKLEAKIMSYVNLLLEYKGNASNTPELPSWFSDPGDTDWFRHIVKEPYKSVIRELRDTRLKYFAGTMQLGDFRKALKDIEKKLS